MQEGNQNTTLVYGGLVMTREEHQALLNFSLATLGYIPTQTDDELQAFEELHKDYIPRIKDMHVDVDKIINGEIKCE